MNVPDLLVDTHKGVTPIPKQCHSAKRQWRVCLPGPAESDRRAKTITVGTTDGNVSEVRDLQPGSVVAATFSTGSAPARKWSSALVQSAAKPHSKNNVIRHAHSFAAGRDLAVDGSPQVIGAIATGSSAISALPEVDYPTIQVITFYPGRVPT